MLPEIVLFGLILVNFLPPTVLPRIYPPISEQTHIHKTNTNALDVSRLNPGIYNLQIMCNNKLVNKTIIKN